MLCDVVNIRGKDDQRFGPDLRDFTQQSYYIPRKQISRPHPHFSERA